MGLDMYLYRAKKHGLNDAKEVLKAIDSASYYYYIEQRNEHAESILKYCFDGKLKNLAPIEVARPFMKDFEEETYYYWDREKRYPTHNAMKQVGHWRKANMIHNWFVKNVQDGEDDCANYEVPREKLEELLSTCQAVLDGTELEDGWVQNGEQWDGEKLIPCLEEGQTVVDSSVAKELLPVAKGFFFGSQGYDQWYVEDIKDTVKILTEVLESTDFENEMVFYRSSW